MRALRVFSTIAALSLMAGAAWQDGWKGLVALALGIGGTAFYLTATWLLVKLVGTASKGDALKPAQTAVAGGAVLAKLPLIYLGWSLSQNLGPFGPTWFLLGLALVYCVLIWRAVLAVRD